MRGAGARRRERRRFVESVRLWSYAHPRIRLAAREAWGAARLVARRLHLPGPFEPAEFADLRHLADPPPAAGPGPTVLVLSFRGWSTHVTFEAAVGLALARRGARPIFAICGGRLPVCDVVPAPLGPPMPCLSCGGYARDALHAAGFSPVAVGDLVDVPARRRAAEHAVGARADAAALAAHCYKDVPLGTLVTDSVTWFLSKGAVDGDDPTEVAHYRRFVVSGRVLVDAFEALLDRTRPDRLFLLNGRFFAERILAELADRRGIPVVCYERGFMPGSVVLGRWGPDVDYLDLGPCWHEERDRPLQPEERATVESYLAERTQGGRMMDNFWEVRVEDAEEVRSALGLRAGRPLVAAFCNILWDQAVVGKERAFAGMVDWATQAVAWAARHPEVDLVVRAHPAEVRLYNHPSREPIAGRLAHRFPTLPPNVRVVDPSSPLSSYTLARLADVCLVYASTIGLEIAAMGKPVLLAARAPYAGRGFTLEPATTAAYWAALDDLLVRPPDEAWRAETRETAIRYAHLFFFRFHQHLEGLDEPGHGLVRVREGAGTASAAFDRVVDGVLGADGPVVAPPAA